MSIGLSLCQEMKKGYRIVLLVVGGLVLCFLTAEICKRCLHPKEHHRANIMQVHARHSALLEYCSVNGYYPSNLNVLVVDGKPARWP